MAAEKTKKSITMSFQVDGEFITELARTWFWEEDKPYEVCEELILTCLSGTNQSEDELRHIAQNIIEGRKKLVGINCFTLEDDNENVRPLSVKIESQYRKLKIEELKTYMSSRMIDYVDPYSTVKSLKAAKEYGVTNYEQCMTWFWYNEDGIDHRYMRPWEPGDDMLLDENDDTELGLWLYNYPELVYDVLTESEEHPSSPYFWEVLYNKIKDNTRFSSKSFKKRNENYLAVCRMKKNKDNITYEPPEEKWTPYHEQLLPDAQKTINLTDEWLAENKEPEKDDDDNAYAYKHHIMSLINHVLKENVDKKNLDKHDRMWLLLPDDYEEWEGLISPSGDFYSCDFGGHNAKAYHLICAFPEKFPGIDYDNIAGMDATNALDDILKQGWCATRYLPTCGNYIQMPRTTSGKCTKAQENAIFDAKIKHDVNVDLSCIGY